MTDAEREQLKPLGRDTVLKISSALVGELIGKGLTFAQAEAMLERAKDLLREAKI